MAAAFLLVHRIFFAVKLLLASFAPRGFLVCLKSELLKNVEVSTGSQGALLIDVSRLEFPMIAF